MTTPNLNDAAFQPTPEQGWQMAHEEATRLAQRVQDWLKANKKPRGRVWAEVEEMIHTGYELKKITDRLYQEGEYGES